MAPREKIIKDESLITPPGQPLRPAEVFSEDREIVPAVVSRPTPVMMGL